MKFYSNQYYKNFISSSSQRKASNKSQSKIIFKHDHLIFSRSFWNIENDKKQTMSGFFTKKMIFMSKNNKILLIESNMEIAHKISPTHEWSNWLFQINEIINLTFAHRVTDSYKKIIFWTLCQLSILFSLLMDYIEMDIFT